MQVKNWAVFRFKGKILPNFSFVLFVVFVVFHPQSWAESTYMLVCQFSINCHHHGLCPYLYLWGGQHAVQR